MNNIAKFNAAEHWTPKQIALMKRTVARDSTDDEFAQFLYICASTRLQPLKRQIYCFIFNKSDPAKRNMVVVTAISGFRTIADRTGDYVPGDHPPLYEYNEEKKSDANPTGLIKATVSVQKHRHGKWFQVTEEALWTEYAPIYKGKLDYKKQGWTNFPTTMLSKVAEAKALRKAFPDDLPDIYSEEEMDQADVIDLTASEIVEEAEKERREELLGGPGIYFQPVGDKAVKVLTGEYFDRVSEYVEKSDPSEIAVWFDTNKNYLNDYWREDGNGGLELKKIIEARIAA